MKTAKAKTDGPKKEKPNAPPAIITLDNKGKEADDQSCSKTSNSDAASQSRTPKHANKVKDTGGGGSGNGGDKKKGGGKGASSKSFAPRTLTTSGPGAFQPHDRQVFPPHLQGLQTSPSASGNRFFPQFNAGLARFNGPFDQRFHGDFSRYDPYRGAAPMFPPRPFQGNEFTGGPNWGPPPFSHGGRYPMHPAGVTNTGSNVVSRAVSSSFDRSIKSRDDKVTGTEPSNLVAPVGNDDNASVSEDASWKDLNQVHSVDEEEMRKRVRERGASTSSEVAIGQGGSNNSSLTNSPTDGLEGKKPTVPDPAKLTSSLDSLSSVASAQEPMETTGNSKAKELSPSGSTGSLDLMKCPSGTSHLLLPSHQRSLSQFSFPTVTGKREHEDEARGDQNTTGKDAKEVRGAPSEEPPTKKGRIELRDPKKSSPLSITCSPSNVPTSGEKESGVTKVQVPKAVYPKKNQSPSFFDQPPSSLGTKDATPTASRDGATQRVSKLNKGAPSHQDSSESRGNPPGVSQLPSWDLQAQDSFGGASASGGNGLISSFSFQQDYPIFSSSGSVGETGTATRTGEQTIETRNQSFDGSHYSNTFGRTDSMVSYVREGPYEGRPSQPSQNQFPPHAPSWGSASSYPPVPATSLYGTGFRGSFPTMLRNFSEDSRCRTPPLLGATSIRTLPPILQPPPEFRAPPSMVSKGGSQNTIITTPYQPTPKNGPFGWTKDEDDRLTEIMKKYKNPRDWEPISKEHSRGRSAKECHERWIRYLKPGVRKGQWTDHEDAIVMEVVSSSKEQPFTRWSDLAQRLPGRVGKQIRDRWVNHLNPAINHLPFSREDDLLLWEGHKKLGKRWVEIATKYFNSSRSENHIKNRWYSASFKKFITNEFGADAYSGTNKSGKKYSPEKKSSPEKKASPDKKGSPGKRNRKGEDKKKATSPRRRSSVEVSQIEAV